VRGKIVLIPFPFTDLTAAKLRPALVLHEGERDVVVAFISSRLPPEPGEADVLVRETHPEFELTGLKRAIREHFERAKRIAEIVRLEIGERT
jgi:mRNA interferase MazF